MATRTLDGGGAVVTHPRYLAPAPAVMAVLSRFDREKIGSAIEVMIALLDVVDGDPDLEPCADYEDDDPLEDDDPAGGNVEDERQRCDGDYDTGDLIPGSGSGV